jgi:hypothetical protein
MPNSIRHLPDEKLSLDTTFQRARATLEASGIRMLAAAEISSAYEMSIGRILLSDPADKERAIAVLLSAKFSVLTAKAAD